MNSWMKKISGIILKPEVCPQDSFRSHGNLKSCVKRLCKKESGILDIETLGNISLLMNGGFSLQQTMQILQCEENRETFEAIDAHLANGQSVDGFMTEYCPKEIRGYLKGFLLCMNLRDALCASLHVVSEEKKEKEILLKGCLYPCMLLAGMLAGIFLFASYVLPSMLSLMNSLAIDETGGYEQLSVLVRLFSIVCMILILACGLALVYFLSPEKISATYALLAARFPDSLLVKMATRDFIRFFLECSKHHASTYESLRMLSEIHEKPLVALIAHSLNTSLLSGWSLEEAMKRSPVESALIRFIHIAAMANECTGMLEGYLSMCTKRTEASIRRFSKNVQLFSYTLIGIVLIFVYSVLMLPMSMLSRI